MTPTPTDTVTLRSRHPNYRWRGIAFERHVAAVTPSQAADAERDPHFGIGRDFWRDTKTPATPAGGGKNETPPVAEAELSKMNKTELTALAETRGVKPAEGATKAEIVAAILNAA